VRGGGHLEVDRDNEWNRKYLSCQLNLCMCKKKLEVTHFLRRPPVVVDWSLDPAGTTMGLQSIFTSLRREIMLMSSCGSGSDLVICA
jgi:hypothetical protein